LQNKRRFGTLNRPNYLESLPKANPPGPQPLVNRANTPNEQLLAQLQQRDGGLCDIKDDLLLASLRDDARFGAILRKMQLPE